MFTEFDTHSVAGLAPNLEQLPWKEALANRKNQDACVQHHLYGTMNDDELFELLPDCLSSRREDSLLEPVFEKKRIVGGGEGSCGALHRYETVEPFSKIYFARSVPDLVVVTDEELEDVSLAKKVVDCFWRGGRSGVG